ncbi:isoaspartyl peptidase/L-asparaginase [Halosegnis sp.]|uniref:isoaspartyl peptidase/L-asparaginase n=1 Tax=Halosegnis sp. TaxID=2864959 RepID=UPI0035D40E94
MQLIVHGGAGSPPDEPPERQAVLDEAAETGAAAASVTDAVCEAVRVLEASPRFNAGVGGAVQSDGIIRTDAGLMTDDRAVGAVASMPGVERAVDVARVVKEETPHVLVSGVHAVDLAAAFDIETGVDLRTPDRDEQFAALEDRPAVEDVRGQLKWLREQFGGSDTVGAVARDGDRLAAATSTGGRWLALAGRVGDVPQVGAGFYCTPAGGVSTTGAGEDIARVTLARQAVDHLEAGLSAPAAADRAIEEFAEITDATAGLILIDSNGQTGEAYNSDAMQTSVAGQ